MVYVFKPWVVLTLKILTVLLAIVGLIGFINAFLTLAYDGSDTDYFITHGLISMALLLGIPLSITTGTLLVKDSDKRGGSK